MKAGEWLEEVPADVAGYASVLPRFSDGRLNYSTSGEAAVVDCYVYHARKLLVLKRVNPLGGLQKPWHVVSGYFDEVRPLGEMAIAEIVEEIGPQKILSMCALPPYCARDSRVWTVYPVAAEISGFIDIRLNVEHSESAWIPSEEAASYLVRHVWAVWAAYARSRWPVATGV
jgi:hypothetical protein